MAAVIRIPPGRVPLQRAAAGRNPGVRQDTAPETVAIDTTKPLAISGEAILENAISCISCHMGRGGVHLQTFGNSFSTLLSSLRKMIFQ